MRQSTSKLSTRHWHYKRALVQWLQLVVEIRLKSQKNHFTIYSKSIDICQHLLGSPHTTLLKHMNIQIGEYVIEHFWIFDVKDPVDHKASRDGSNNVAAGDNFYIISDHSICSLFCKHISREDNLWVWSARRASETSVFSPRLYASIIAAYVISPSTMYIKTMQHKIIKHSF